MPWLPTAKAVVLKEATPVPTSTLDEPMGVAPSKKVTVPVGPGFGLTTATKLTDWPNTDGLENESNPVVVAVVARAGSSASSDIAQPASRTTPFSRVSLPAHTHAAPQRRLPLRR